MGRTHKTGDDYVEQVQDAFWDATLEGDWVNFSAQSRLSSEIYDAVESARKFMAKGNPEPAIEIGFAIIENDIGLINHNDDSCGYLGTIMRLGLELLHDVSKLELDDDNRELFQDYCEDCLKKRILSGWDWDFDIYECLISLLQTPKETKQLIKRIEKDGSLARDDFVHKLADDVLKSRSPERYAEICSIEGWHQELMDFVGKQFRIGLLQEYEKQLLPQHREEIIECYVRYIYRLMEYSRGRDTYREICNYLRHISSYGAEHLAAETATDLRTKYRRCRALIEELDKMTFVSQKQ